MARCQIESADAKLSGTDSRVGTHIRENRCILLAILDEGLLLLSGAFNAGRHREPRPTAGTRMKAFVSLLLGTWLLIGWTPSVWACCTSALSCVAAVASAGTTCIVDAALSALQIARGQLEKDRTTRQREFDEALRQMSEETTATVTQAQQSADEAMRSLRAADAEARRITGEDKAAIRASLDQSVVQQAPPLSGPPQATSQANRLARLGTAAAGSRIAGIPSGQTSSSPTTDPLLERQRLLADGSLESMQRMIESELRKATQINGQQLTTAKQAAVAQRAAVQQQLHNTFNDVVILGVDGLIVAITQFLRAQNILEAPKFIVVVVAEMATLIERYQRQLEPALRSAGTQLAQQLDPVRAAAAMMQQHAMKAGQILAQMQQAVRLQTAAERQATMAAVANNPSAIPTRASVQLKTPPLLSMTSQRMIATVANLKTDLQRVTTAPPPVNLTAIQSNMRASFDQAFRGQTPAQIGTTRDRLLQEARSKYGSDRNLLTAMEQTIYQEARIRGGT